MTPLEGVADLTTRGDQLISRIIADNDDAATHELLNECFAGYPVEKLRRLLNSDRPEAVEAGAWIASELGEQVAALIPDLRQLLSHPSRRVRFFVLDGLLNAGTAEHGEELGAAMETIQDPDEAVRWKAMNFLARASDEQLTASIPFIKNRHVADRVRWLVESDRIFDTAAVTRELENPDRDTRIVAAATAVRLASRDEAALRRAVASMDREINSFAREQMRLRWWRRAT